LNRNLTHQVTSVRPEKHSHKLWFFYTFFCFWDGTFTDTKPVQDEHTGRWRDGWTGRAVWPQITMAA